MFLGQETEVTSTPTRPVDNVAITTKYLQDSNINISDGTTVENKGKFILTEIFPSVQKHDIKKYLLYQLHFFTFFSISEWFKQESVV